MQFRELEKHNLCPYITKYTRVDMIFYCNSVYVIDICETCIEAVAIVNHGRICVVFLQIIKDVGFEGSFKEFLEMLRTEKRFYYDTKVSFISSSS